ncbi:MAG: TIGR00725 family protein [Chitinophagales bacterium]|nr:TIGR00725 family protein [Chitinophagales bacterium]MDW8427316.1 TIGR00725 family protein [Chitinophagales bacterium]
MVVGIIGPNADMCPDVLYTFGVELGAALASRGHFIVCGGEGGFMEAVCRGAKKSAQTFQGQTIGILPGHDKKQLNPYIDVPIISGLGVLRNVLIVRTADVLIAAGGGAGTLSELAFAWQLGKTVLCVPTFEGWAAELAQRPLDQRRKELFISVTTVEEILEKLDKFSANL